MPTKAGDKNPNGPVRKENRGFVQPPASSELMMEKSKNSFRFAYVDFATPEAKVAAIAMSENPLDGRRLLIKDGEHAVLR